MALIYSCTRSQVINEVPPSSCRLMGLCKWDCANGTVQTDHVFLLQKSGRIQSVTPVTSAQLLAAEEVSEGIFKINGKEVGMVGPQLFRRI